MKRALLVVIAAAAMAGFAGCGSTRTDASPAAVRGIPVELPPSPTTWPPYPNFSQHSCWARPFGIHDVHTVEGVAPSYARAPQTRPTAPTDVARRLLADFGDRRYVRSIRLTPAPPAVGRRIRALYAGGHPPADALQAEVVVPAANESGHLSPEENLAAGIAQYEGDIIGGALRDDLCDAGGAPLVMWGTNGSHGVADSFRAVGQRFPNPSPAAFRKRVALVGKRFGFTVVSLRLLRPRQIAPLLIVATHRPRKAFMKDIPTILELLNPHAFGDHRSAYTFEGFFFAAEDAKGPFTWSLSVLRNDNTSGGWAANRCLWPYPPMGPVGPGYKPCP